MAKRITDKIHFLIVSLFWALVLGVILFLTAFTYYARAIPSPDVIVSRRINESTKILDRTGEVILYNVHGEEKRTIIPAEEIPEHMKKAVIATEDINFYNHRGLDLKGIARALVKNIETASVSQGGSTITQQLVKKALLGDERTLSRKFKEIILSLQVEQKFSKEEILWMYLNQIPFGSNNYGLESASQFFFQKKAKDLTINESATLAAMIKAPSYYSPSGSHKNELLARKNVILKKMKDLGFITKEELNSSLNENLEFKASTSGIKAPHFVLMVREYLIEKYGEDMVENGGLTVYTTLDWKLQEKAEQIVKEKALQNEKLYRAKNAALVAIDPKTGQVLTMVGSRDYFDEKIDGNFNVATALRQPGSAFKPIAYSVALEKGLTDNTVLFDVPTEFNPKCSASARQVKEPSGLACYNPQNYDGRYRGPVTLRYALGNSLNIPSVKVLYLAGIDRVIEKAKDIGITSFDNPSRFGLSLVLGGAEVRLLELASAYGAFANDGIYNPHSFILKVEAPKGRILEQHQEQADIVMPQQIARMINSILSDNRARMSTFGPSSAMYFAERPVAAKTGTTQDNRDGWLVGYTPSIVVGIWTGNNDNSQMTKTGAGISAAGPMWREFMKTALENTPVERFPEPEPLFTDKIILNGAYILGGREIHSELYYINKDDPAGPFPDNPFNDPQFKNWEQSVIATFGQLTPEENNPQPENPSPIEIPSPTPEPSPALTPVPIPTYNPSNDSY